ncbi:MAG: DUF1223 domain-containing protein [Neptuniibacter sp.]
MESQFLRTYLLAILLLPAQQVLAGQTFQHEGQPPQLIELYTSEGCSSCPPADSYMSSLINSPNLWKNIIPLAFHVDYWDYIGWPDRFAHPSYKQRQYSYRQAGRLRSVYTPGWVIDGNEWRGFFQGQQLPMQSSREGGKLKVDYENQQLDITYKPKKSFEKLTAHIALIGFDQQSTVTAGENRGRILKHQFVVMNKQEKTQPNFQWQFRVPDSDVSRRHALAIWVATPDFQILQAVAGWVEN